MYSAAPLLPGNGSAFLGLAVAPTHTRHYGSVWYLTAPRVSGRSSGATLHKEAVGSAMALVPRG